jgi:hypothetical protein
MEIRLPSQDCKGCAVDPDDPETSMNLLDLQLVVSRMVSILPDLLGSQPMAWRLHLKSFDMTSIRHLQWLRRPDPVVTFLSKGNPMKRFVASVLIIGVSSFGLVGCEEKGSTVTTEKVKTPTGSEETTIKVEDKKTGDMKDSEKEKTVPVTPETPK